MVRTLFLAGAVPFVVLGAAHAFHTPRRMGQRKGLSPRDEAIEEAMARTPLRLTSRTDLWLTWVGFNYSHSLGAVLFGAAVALVGRSPSAFAANAAVFLPFAALVSLTYLVLGVRYWFRTPIAGLVVSTACFWSAWLLHLAR
jgi:ammonia channel protein AmtB